jgi:gas vesicle protein
MSSDSDEFGSFLVGFIVGGLTGAVVSLLFAPQSGEETRALIRDKSIELRDQASDTAEAALARAEAAAAEARARAEELAKVARARAEELAKDMRARGEEFAKDMRTRGEDAMDAVRKTSSKKSGGGEPLSS